MGFTQRQAAGKFTAAEAQAFIDDLQAAEYARGHDRPAGDPSLAAFSDQQLAGELQRRGWIVVEP